MQFPAVIPTGAVLSPDLPARMGSAPANASRTRPLPAASKKVTLTLKPSVVGSKLSHITCLQVGVWVQVSGMHWCVCAWPARAVLVWTQICPQPAHARLCMGL